MQPRGCGPAPTPGSGRTTRPAWQVVIRQDREHPAFGGQPRDGDAQVGAPKRGCINGQHPVPGEIPPRVVLERHHAVHQAPLAPDAPAQHGGDPAEAVPAQSAQRGRLRGGGPALPRRARERPGLGHVVAHHAPIALGGPRDLDRRLAHPGMGHGAGRQSPMAMPPRAAACGTRGRARTAHGHPPARRHLLPRLHLFGGQPQHGGRPCIILRPSGGTLLRRCQLSTN